MKQKSPRALTTGTIVAKLLEWCPNILLIGVIHRRVQLL